jgi:hypothetical protein
MGLLRHQTEFLFSIPSPKTCRGPYPDFCTLSNILVPGMG